MQCLACGANKLRMGRVATGSALQNSVSRRMTAQDEAAGAMASNWAEAFEKLQSRETPVQRRAAAARASTRVEALREVQDRVADRPALPARSSTVQG
jgi:hypothetical protein